MSEKQQKVELAECPIGLHQSWASFPMSEYEQIIAFGVFTTPGKELLFIQNEDGWGLPREKITVGKLLLDTPDRLVARQIGREPGQLLPPKEKRRVTILGACSFPVGDRQHYLVFLEVPLTNRLVDKRYRYVGRASLPPVKEVDVATLNFATGYLGWSYSKAMAA